MEHFDVVIAGAGIIGCQIAYHLAKEDCTNVLVIDKSGIASDITGICPGGVRQQWGTEINCRMARHSLDFFREMNERLDPERPLSFREVGYLYTFHSKEAVHNYEKNMKLQNSLDIPTKILTPEETLEHVPGLNPNSFMAASFCATDGFVDDAYDVTHSIAEAAKRKGVQFINDEVQEIQSEGGRVQGVVTKKRGPIRADVVINAAGLGAKELAGTIGVELPITFDVRRILYTNRVKERILEPLLVSFEKGFAAKQLTDGVLYLSYLGRDIEPPFDRFDFQLKAATAGMELFPPLENVQFHTHVDGTYDSTPDHQAVLGDAAGIEGYLQAVGMSGHGFMMSPAIGEAVAYTLLNKKLPISIDPLNLSRFEKDALLLEPSVV